MTISLIVKECLHCGQLIEQCWYQQKMREFGLLDEAEAMSREIEVPPWTSSNSPQTS